MITGASEQHPRHETVSIVKSLSGVVSPLQMPSVFSIASVIVLAPLT